MSTVYSVTRLNNEIKDLLDAVPGYRNLLVQGEISNYKAHSSGHHYMTLKDEGASINASCSGRTPCGSNSGWKTA